MARQRPQLSLDDEQYETVARLAASQKRPIPEIVRDLVDLGIERMKKRTEQGREALLELNQLRRSIEARTGICQNNPVAEARAERERQVEAVLSTANKK